MNAESAISRVTSASARSSLCAACRCSTRTGDSVPSTPTSVWGAIECDLVIVAAGMRPDAGEFGLPINPSGTIQVDKETLQTEMPYVFAAGDVVTGPTMITTAAGLGSRAAFMMDRWLQGEAMNPGELDVQLPMVEKTSVLGRRCPTETSCRRTRERLS